MVPSGLILSTTLHITTDVVAMPLLWVLPLAAYLLSFTVAFAASRRLAGAILRIAAFILLLACFGVFMDRGRLLLFFGPLAIVNLFTLSVVLHSRLYELRPAEQQLTLFYLAISVGGALGGMFCALIAPMIFNWTYEHLLLLIAAGYLMQSPSIRPLRQPLGWRKSSARRNDCWELSPSLCLRSSVRGLRPAGFGEAEPLAALGILAVGDLRDRQPAASDRYIAACCLRRGAGESCELYGQPGQHDPQFLRGSTRSARRIQLRADARSRDDAFTASRTSASPEREPD